MRRLLAVAAVALIAAGAASADPLPSAQAPNLVGVLIPQLLVPPAQPEQLTYEQLLPIWKSAGQAYGIPWSVLAAINKVESNFGQNMGPSSAGAIGWMQFMPDTWARWGTDADDNGVADPWNPTDAIYSAARYLAAAGGATDIHGAVFSYNHAEWYVDEVLQLANQYDSGGVQFATALQSAQVQLETARKAIVDATTKLNAANQHVGELQARESVFLAKADATSVLSEQLDAQKAAALVDFQVQAAQADADAANVELKNAQAQLVSAQTSTASMSFAPGASQVLGTPAYSDGYVFPVGGGAGVVSVGHTHHDYPAADIDAPEGTPVYDLSDGTVDNAWTEPDPKCGIGFTISTTDGLTWTYCHMASLDPAVVTGAQLTAGQFVGLVGETGDADGPHLHLQLQPATGYPQDEPWFQSFAGTAFTWTDQVQSDPAKNPVFAVVGGDVQVPQNTRGLADSSQPVIFFTTGS